MSDPVTAPDVAPEPPPPPEPAPADRIEPERLEGDPAIEEGEDGEGV